MSDTKNHYIERFKAFESTLNGQASSPIHKIRQKAISVFDENGFPTSRDEAWKSVNLSTLTEAYTLSEQNDGSSESLLGSLGYTVDGPTLVFVDGYLDASATQLGPLEDGLTVASLAAQFEQGSASEHLSTVISLEDHPFSALNTAFLRDGAYVHAQKGAVIASPVHIVYISTGQSNAVSFPRSLLVAEANSQLTVIESFVGQDDAEYLTNHVCEIVVGDNAQLDHYKIGLEGNQARHVANQQSVQGRSSDLRSHSISIGGDFVRNDVSSALDGEGCESTVNGLYVLNGSQHCDNYTLLEHRQPHCPSHELYKGILADDARSIFRGKIHVHQIAQKTDAYQQNQNVLLSDNARVNTKPQLEIYADDVKCSHGATIGQIDDDALFYLQARGINKAVAHRMLLEAFAYDVLSRIKIDSVREALIERVLDKIASSESE